MSKRSNASRVMNYLTNHGISYRVLDVGKYYPIHIRCKNIDIWPSTGSYKIKGKVVSRDLDGLLDLLKGSVPRLTENNLPTSRDAGDSVVLPLSKDESARITQLETTVLEHREYIEDLEIRLKRLEAQYG